MLDGEARIEFEPVIFDRARLGDRPERPKGSHLLRLPRLSSASRRDHAPNVFKAFQMNRLMIALALALASF
jgi:hypothetical protein